MAQQHYLADSDRARALEILGAPAAGKTSLREELCVAPGVAPVSIYWSLRHLPRFLRTAVSLAPIALRQEIKTRYPKKAYRWMARLDASLAVLARAAKPGVSVLVLDQGPVFTMARLLEAFPAAARTTQLNRWWSHAVESWAQALDAIVVLDATDDVLLSRIRSRSKPHALKQESPAKARHGILRERLLQDAAIAEIRQHRPIPVLRFDTSREPVGRIAAQTMTKLGRSASTTDAGGALRAR